MANLKELLRRIPKEEYLYFHLLDAIYLILEKDLLRTEDVKRALGEIRGEIDFNLTSETIDKDRYRYWKRLDRYIYDFRQDLWTIYPPSLKDTFARTLISLTKVYSIIHGPRHRELAKYFSNFIQTARNLLANNDDINHRNLINKINAWDHIRSELDRLRVAAEAMYNAGVGM